ncbi:MAG: hypothetical protein QOI77_2823 [Blastocatellia bacterium]|jgi:hypothetical protein|nr:hypothetical protein [Blastocatellia bacterium]
MLSDRKNDKICWEVRVLPGAIRNGKGRRVAGPVSFFYWYLEPGHCTLLSRLVSESDLDTLSVTAFFSVVAVLDG